MDRVTLANITHVTSVISSAGTEYVAYIDIDQLVVGKYTENGILELDRLNIHFINVYTLSVEILKTSLIIYITAQVNSKDTPSQLYRHQFDDIVAIELQLPTLRSDEYILIKKYDETIARLSDVEHTANNARHSAAMSAKVTDITATSLENSVSRLERKIVSVENNAIEVLQASNTAQQQEIEQLKALFLELSNKVYGLPTREYVEVYISNYLKDEETMITSDTSIIGYIPLMIETVLSKFKIAVGNYTLYDINKILTLYDKYAKIANINPYILIAQMAHETDWTRSRWASRPYRNPAGYGVTGRTETGQKPKETETSKWVEINKTWHEGFSFESWDKAIQVHIGHLLAYTLTDAQLTPIQRLLVEQSPRAVLIKRGEVHTLQDLDGRWAKPGNGYGNKIAAIANTLK